MNSKLIALIFLVITIVLGIVFYVLYPTPSDYQNEQDKPRDGGVACTMEAKLCPDGSYVGREGPNCEFKVCPIPEGVQMEDGTI